MLKKSMITAAAAIAIVTGATALKPSPAEAGVTIQLVHGSGHGFRLGRGFWFGPRWRHHGFSHRHRGPHFGRGVVNGRKLHRGAKRPSVTRKIDNRNGKRGTRNGGRNIRR